jgi:hypothetical protein
MGIMFRRALLAAACAAAFTVAGLGTASAKSINTYKSWDGSQYVYAFGCPNTTTYGQVITAPNTATLNKFSFWWANAVGSGSMVVRGEVYAWDGTKATGSALWESKAKKISYGDSSFHRETFKTGPLPLTPGAQYVLFASLDKDFEKCEGDYTLEWGLVDDSVYPAGTFVYQNNGGDESQWTATSWSTYGGDVALKAAFH